MWESLPTYKVTYDNGGADGSAPVDNGCYLEGDSVKVLGQGSLSKSGYRFSGWLHPGGTVYTADQVFSMGTGDVTLTAQWTEEDVYFKVSFNSVEGTSVPDQSVKTGGCAKEPNPAPARSGYTFAGWYLNPDYSGSPSDFKTRITQDITLYARRTQSGGGGGGECFPIFSATASFFELFESS